MRDLDAAVRTWALSDDEERAELIESASANALQQLWNEVSPHFDEINGLLEHETRERTAIGELAQTALEAQRELRRRGLATS